MFSSRLSIFTFRRRRLRESTRMHGKVHQRVSLCVCLRFGLDIMKKEKSEKNVRLKCTQMNMQSIQRRTMQ